MYDGTRTVADVVRETFELGYKVDTQTGVRMVNFGSGLVESTVQLYLGVEEGAWTRTVAGIFVPSYGNTDYSNRLYVRLFPNADTMDESNITRISKTLPYEFDFLGKTGHYII